LEGVQVVRWKIPARREEVGIGVGSAAVSAWDAKRSMDGSLILNGVMLDFEKLFEGDD
jgi:hypothetical protein